MRLEYYPILEGRWAAKLQVNTMENLWVRAGGSKWGENSGNDKCARDISKILALPNVKWTFGKILVFPFSWKNTIFPIKDFRFRETAESGVMAVLRETWQNRSDHLCSNAQLSISKSIHVNPDLNRRVGLWHSNFNSDRPPWRLLWFRLSTLVRRSKGCCCCCCYGCC